MRFFFLQDAVKFKNMWAQHVQPFAHTAQLRIAHSSRLDKECTSATLFRLLIPKIRREQRGGEKKQKNKTHPQRQSENKRYYLSISAQKAGFLNTYQAFAVAGDLNEALSLTQQEHTDEPGGNRAVNTARYANKAEGDAHCIFFLLPYPRKKYGERETENTPLFYSGLRVMSAIEVYSIALMELSSLDTNWCRTFFYTCSFERTG